MLEFKRNNILDGSYDIKIPSFNLLFGTLDIPDTLEVVSQNTGRKFEVEFDNNVECMPDKIIFNGDATVGIWGDEKIVLYRSEEDEYNPIVAFLYLYFLNSTGMSKTQANKFLSTFEKVNMTDEQEKSEEKIKNIENIMNKNLDLDSFVKEMQKVIKN